MQNDNSTMVNDTMRFGTSEMPRYYINENSMEIKCITRMLATNVSIPNLMVANPMRQLQL